MVTLHHLIILNTRYKFVLYTLIDHQILKEFSQWVQSIEQEIKKIEEKHGITHKQVQKIIDDAKKLKNKKRFLRSL